MRQAEGDTMTEFVEVATVDQLEDPGKTILEVADRIVVLVHVNGLFYCIDDVCTHDDGPLSDGELDGCDLICPRHGARFDVCTGKAKTLPATRPTASHEVKVENGAVFVKVCEDD